MRDSLFFSKLRVFLGAWRWRHHRRGSWLKARLRKWRRRMARRRTGWAVRPVTRVASPFMLEPLEGRLLLAADLTGAITAHTLNDPNIPTNGESVTVHVQNQGTTATAQTSQVAVYA